MSEGDMRVIDFCFFFVFFLTLLGKGMTPAPYIFSTLWKYGIAFKGKSYRVLKLMNETTINNISPHRNPFAAY